MLLLRGATSYPSGISTAMPVSIHAPLARSNGCRHFSDIAPAVSIHAPLARSNSVAPLQKPVCSCFNTCSSCEEQHAGKTGWRRTRTFQYMLLLRGATQGCGLLRIPKMFQYMLLLRGATSYEECFKVASNQFQYMLLLRGATTLAQYRAGHIAFQYMLLLRGATGVI